MRVKIAFHWEKCLAWAVVTKTAVAFILLGYCQSGELVPACCPSAAALSVQGHAPTSGRHCPFGEKDGGALIYNELRVEN